MTTFQIQDSVSLISRLKTAHLRNDFKSYIFIKNLFKLIEPAIPAIITHNKFVIYRCRINSKRNFERISDISHRKDIFNISNFGRVNEPMQSIFYGSTDPFASYIETTTVLRSKTQIDLEIFTVGKWESTREINLAVIPFHESITRINPEAQLINEKLFKFVSEKSAGISPPLEVLYSFLREEFMRTAEGENDYFIPTAFLNHLLDQNESLSKKSKYDGLIYPSVQTGGSGLNVAIFPELVDHGELELVHVSKRSAKRIRDFEYTFDDALFSEAIGIDKINNRINWP